MANALLIILSRCLHKEADTCLLLHAADAVKRAQKIYVRTVDTDIVVITIAMFNQIDPDELWLAFGVGSNFHYIPVHKVAREMDPRIVLPCQSFMQQSDVILSHLFVE